MGLYSRRELGNLRPWLRAFEPIDGRGVGVEVVGQIVGFFSAWVRLSVAWEAVCGVEIGTEVAFEGSCAVGESHLRFMVLVVVLSSLSSLV